MFARSDISLHPRAFAWLGFFAVIAGFWLVLYAMTAAQAGWLALPHDILGLPWSGLPLMAAMWATMMLAMMLPTLVPALAAFEALPGARVVGAAGIVVGYAGLWGLGAAGFAAVQVGLMRLGLADGGGLTAGPWPQVALLAVAGIWQFTRAKAACQDACLSPLSYFIGRFRPGGAGGLVMGAELGAWCIGCCWAIMALALIGGATSLLWMGLATAFMIAEKLPAVGAGLRRPAGAVLVALAVGLALTTLLGATAQGILT